MIHKNKIAAYSKGYYVSHRDERTKQFSDYYASHNQKIKDSARSSSCYTCIHSLIILLSTLTLILLSPVLSHPHLAVSHPPLSCPPAISYPPSAVSHPSPDPLSAVPHSPPTISHLPPILSLILLLSFILLLSLIFLLPLLLLPTCIILTLILILLPLILTLLITFLQSLSNLATANATMVEWWQRKRKT